jgi:hypothetical protein
MIVVLPPLLAVTPAQAVVLVAARAVISNRGGICQLLLNCCEER